MTPVRVFGRWSVAARVMPATQRALRALLLVTGGAALALPLPAWRLPQGAVAVAGALALLGSLAAPRGVAPLCVIGAAVVEWLLRSGLDEPVPAGPTLLLAVSLYLFHSTAAFVAVLPVGAAVDGGTVRRWYGREVPVLAATGLVGVAALALGTVRGGLVVDLVGLVGVIAVPGVLVLLARRYVTDGSPSQQESPEDDA